MREQIINTPFSNWVILALFFLCSAITCSRTHHENAAEIIIAKEKAALDRWNNGDTFGFIELAADEMTYFDPYLDKRLDGLDAFKEWLTPLNGTFRIHRYEMLNPNVQLHGDVGILTFNLNNYAEDDSVTSRWNSTEVYHRIHDDWKLIHSHWSYTKPEKNE